MKLTNTFTSLATLSLLTLFFLAPHAHAMPTPAQLEKARLIIQELMAEDFAALKSGKKKAEDVGDAAMKLVANAETEAAKFLLCKAAFGLYIRGKSYDKAADVLETFRESISDLPIADLVELVQKNAKGVRGKDAPKLFAAYWALQAKATAEKERDKARAALAGNPTDATLRRTYAEWCVHAGDWKLALTSFAKLGGDFEKAVKNETVDLAAAADFWWTYEPTIKSSNIKSSEVFKDHARSLYESALDKGQLSGLKKTLAKKRLSQAGLEVVEVHEIKSAERKVQSAKYVGVKLVGSSVKNNHGILTGFTEKSYAIIEPPFVPQGKTFEFVVEFTPREKTATPQAVVTCFGDKNALSPWYIAENGQLQGFASSNGQSFDIAKALVQRVTLQLGKSCLVKCSWDGSGYSWFVWNERWQECARVVNAAPVYDGLRFCIGSNRGKGRPLLGSVNLNKSYLLVDGKLWWSGTRNQQVR